MTNIDDGSFHDIKIKSSDGQRVVKFTAVPARHERNREFVRPVEVKVEKGQGVHH